MMSKVRCSWTGDSVLYQAYHDNEWGVPQHDDRTLFEFLLLEGAQAGLSWITILKKRPNYRLAFDQFDAALIARYGANKIESLLQDAGIVRNRLKVQAAVTNAQNFLALQDKFGSFDAFIWRFVSGVPKQNHWRSHAEVPVHSEESAAMSRELAHYGFKFVGPTICYAYMQAIGMVNDHTTDCFRHKELRCS